MIWRLAKGFYGLPNETITDRIDLVVPLGYGFSKTGLPDAAVKTTAKAAKIALKFNAPIIYCNVEYLGKTEAIAEDNAKLTIFNEILGKNNVPVIRAEFCTNSVREARNIRKAWLEHFKGEPCEIVVVCDWPHTRSTRIIYEQTFPNSTLRIVSVCADWDKNHLVPAQQSNLKWLVTNFKRHAALLIMGLDWVAKIQHKPK